MRHIAAFLITLLFSLDVSSQDKGNATYELGSNIATVALPRPIYNTIVDCPYYQFFNGLFFRLTKNRSALRATLSYSQHRSESVNSSPNQFGYNPGGLSYNTDLKGSLGGQYSLLKKKEYLYGFADLYYRNLTSNGALYGLHYFSEKTAFYSYSDQIGLNSGIGFKIKIFKQILISPEIFCDIYSSKTKLVSYSPSNSMNPDHTIYSQTNLRPSARVFLTVAF